MGTVHTNRERLGDAEIARVTIDRTDKLNALDGAMIDKVIDAFAGLADDESIRAVVFDAAGDKAWIGGADIKEMAAIPSPEAARAFISHLHTAMLAVRNLPVPVIAQVDGYCLGGGMELAAACDLRIASEAAHFGMPEVQVGLPSVIEASLLPGIMGRGRAARLVLTGEVIDAARAYEWGFVEEVVARDQLDAAVRNVTEAICKAGPVAMRSQKKLLRHWEQVHPDQAAEDSVAVFGGAFESGEATALLSQFAKR